MISVSTRRGYDLWAETYPPTPHNPLMRAEHDALARRLAPIRSASALDVGSGSGRCVALLAATGAARVVAVDLSLPMLDRNAHRARVCADALRLPFASGSFDLVNASLVAGDMPDLTAWCCELGRLLAPGGHLIYSDFHPIWAALGWQRTFRDAAGAPYVLPHHHHRVGEHGVALSAAGLAEVAVDEIRLAPPRRGRLDWFRRREPVAVLVHGRKTV